MSRKRGGRRNEGGEIPESITVAEVTSAGDESPRAVRSEKNTGLEYAGKLNTGGLRFPHFNISWGAIISGSLTLIAAVIAATITVLSFTNGLSGSLEKITEIVRGNSSDLRNLRDADTRNEERVSQLQRSVEQTHDQLLEHRRIAEQQPVDRSAPRPSR